MHQLWCCAGVEIRARIVWWHATTLYDIHVQEFAYEESQKYKEGKYILEKAVVMKVPLTLLGYCSSPSQHPGGLLVTVAGACGG